MTETPRQDKSEAGADPCAGGAEPALQADVYSKDYWDLVFEQLSRRSLFKVGMGVLALLYALAVYAPLIANDRPYVLEAVDLKAYKSATGSLRAPVSELAKLLETSDEDYARGLRERVSISGGGEEDQVQTALERTRSDAIAEEFGAARLRVAVARRYLPDDQEGDLDRYSALLGEIETLFAQGDEAGALAKAEEAKDLARGLRKSLAAWDPRKPEREGMKLIGAKSYPLWESLSPLEIFFMALLALLLTWPLWNRVINRVLLRGDREDIRRWRRRKALLVLGLCLLASLAWSRSAMAGKGSAYDAAQFKSDLASGNLVLIRAGHTIDEPDAASNPIWPPIVFGYAEQHQEEGFRPPTWLASAKVDEEGRYMQGGRREIGDETSGAQAAVTPVEVLPFEPERNAPSRHLAGTDSMGRDFMTRMLWGGRISLTVGILSALLLTVIGVVFGALAGYFGGWVDIVIMRVIEIIQSMPAFFLILAAMAFTDPKVMHPVFTIVFVIALIRWTGTARLVRGEFMRLREQEFVLAAEALGFSNRRTIFRHVLPNAMSPVLVSAAFSVAAGILTESAVSFLGMGMREPAASWGSLVNDTKNASFWWIQVFPGFLIFITVTCYNLVGDAVRDALDPKMKL